MLVRLSCGDYERLRKDGKFRMTIKVGEWFHIDREIIDKNKEEIYRKCNEAGARGKLLLERFEYSNKIADEHPDEYPRLIETYIFESWRCRPRTETELRDLCETVGDGMCDEVICDLELQMRICNGESMDDLIKYDDLLPNVRLIKYRNEDTGFFGGGFYDNIACPPATLVRRSYNPFSHDPIGFVAYAFRRVLS